MVRQGDDDEDHSVSHGALRALLGSPKACRNFLDWAERCGLLVRGVFVKCDRCGRASWKLVGGLAPPILCSGCGVPVGRPFQGGGFSW
jgi:ribosomal protein L37E